MTRTIATVAAVILLLGQTFAAAHFHRVSTQREVVSGAAGMADGSCAICAAHLHSAAALAVAPALDAPTIQARITPCAVHTGPLSTFTRSRFGRAPPASI
jgi:hypothetical protein